MSRLNEIGETKFLKMLAERFDVIDDAALFRARPNSLICCDAFVSGRHFDTQFSSHFDVGFKSVQATVSDIAAMGGRPDVVVVSIGCVGDANTSDLLDLMDGIAQSCEESGAKLVGGDTTSASELWVSVAVVGHAGRALRRKGAQPEDFVVVTGALGGAQMGLELLRRGEEQRCQSCVRRHKRPEARVDWGEELARAGATACIDLSDGLFVDLEKLCADSGVGCEVDYERVPIDEEVLRLCAELDLSPLDMTGEDYELVATLPKGAEIPSFATVIGTIVESGMTLLTKDGRSAWPQTGYEHFR